MPLPNLTGSAMTDLGLGGSLADQVAGETEEERKKRMAQMQQMRQLGPSGSLAVTSLLGGGAPRGT
jgi:RecA/RadA recombinase